MKKLLKGLLRYGSGGIGIFLLIEVFQTASAKFLFEESIQLSYWQKAFILMVIAFLFRFVRKKTARTKGLPTRGSLQLNFKSPRKKV